MTAESEIGPLTRPLRTMIVDDETLAIERMQILCAREPRLALVGTAKDGESAQRLVEGVEPDLLLLAIAMPGLDGMEEGSAWGTSHFNHTVVLVPDSAGF